MTKHATNGRYAIPASIVIAGALIAGSLFLALSRPQGSSGAVRHPTARAPGADFRLPDDSDHVRGEASAKVTIIEFSDLECPFCARLHPTLTRIVEENLDVKWVYRHFPLSSIHSRAFGAALASECIARLGGNGQFWKFTDEVFSDQSGRLNDAFYGDFAARAGIDGEAFKGCLADKSIAAEVGADNDEAVSSGGQGTPFSVIVTASGALIPFSGALPYEDVARLVEQARSS